MEGSVVATPGYFGITLQNGVQAESELICVNLATLLTRQKVTVTSHAALYRFTFPSNPTGFPASPLILVDLTDLRESRTGGAVSVDPTSGQLTGNATFAPSFGEGLLFPCST